jgi:hypothetical protein
MMGRTKKEQQSFDHCSLLRTLSFVSRLISLDY